MHKVLEERRAERERRIAKAREFAEKAARELGPITVWVYGSVARGDFNLWSDVDVFLVAKNLPGHPLDRFALLFRWAPPGVEPRGFTLEEFQAALAKGDAQLISSLGERVLIRDELGLEETLAGI